MYKVFISKYASKTFDNFLIYQKMNCIYRGTGLFNEELIIENYERHFIEVIDNIKNKLEDNLSVGMGGLLIKQEKDIVYYKKVIHLKHYHMITHYKQDDKQKTITITDLIIKTS